MGELFAFPVHDASPHVAEAAPLTGLSVPLFLYSRQAHYYPEAMLLTVAAIRAYQAAWTSRRAAVALAGFMALLFHANFVTSVLLWMVFVLHLCFVRPESSVTKRVITAGAAWLLIVAPFALWARIWDRTLSRLDPHNPYYVLAAPPLPARLNLLWCRSPSAHGGRVRYGPRGCPGSCLGG
jgi:hypothetical protein